MHARYAPARRDVEEALLGALSPEAPWSLIEHFANENLIRESGSEDERTAAQYISNQLTPIRRQTHGAHAGALLERAGPFVPGSRWPRFSRARIPRQEPRFFHQYAAGRPHGGGYLYPQFQRQPRR